MEIDRSDYIVKYTDMYGNELSSTRYTDLTKEEVWQAAEKNTPRDRAIEDFNIIKINKDGTKDTI